MSRHGPGPLAGDGNSLDIPSRLSSQRSFGPVPSQRMPVLSSSTSSNSNSNKAPRTPLHERSNSESNRLSTIRMVPYSPPKPENEMGDPTDSHAGDSSNENCLRIDLSSPIHRGQTYGDSPAQSHSELSSPTWSTNSTTRPSKGKGVSDWRSPTESPEFDLPSSPTSPRAPALRRPPSFSSSISSGNRGRSLTPQAPPRSRDSSRSNSSWSRPPSRSRRTIKLNADKTFSVALQPTTPQVPERIESTSWQTDPYSNTSTISSHEQSGSAFDNPSENPPSTPLSSLAEQSLPPSTPGPSAAHELTSSPWNYQLVGGLRKVAKTPDASLKGRTKGSPPPLSLPPLPEVNVAFPEPATLAAKPSFTSEFSDCTLEHSTNYKVVGRSSPVWQDSDSVDIPASSPGTESNFRVLGQSSPAHPYTPSARGRAATVLDTPGSQNLVTHGGYSPSSSIATFPRRPRFRYSDDSLVDRVRDQYSQESLVVPPLNPRRQPSFERFGYYKRLSRESLRGRANSFSSISSIISQDTASLFLASQNFTRLNPKASNSSLQRASWAGPSTGAAPHRSQMEAHPHQWSSQLSTVVSEDERSEGTSRVFSVSSLGDRLSSGPGSLGGSLGSRHMLEMSPESPEENSPEVIERPNAVYMMRGGREPVSPRVRHHDENGDGLADLHDAQQLHHKSSWRSFLRRRPSDRELHTSGSATANMPLWARVYYGSGERRLWQPPSISNLSEAAETEADQSWANESPSHGYDTAVHVPRRRPREFQPHSRQASSVIERPQAALGHRHDSHHHQTLGIGELRRGPRKMTSSIWSPHLQTDRRASEGSMWDPPSIAWSAESGMFGRRNIQVLLFVIGFINPLSWFAASFLPLPPKPYFEMLEVDPSTSTGLGIVPSPPTFSRPPSKGDEKSYHTARWWRNLNRLMSVLGLLIIGIVVALVIVGTKQKWTQ